MTGLSERTPDFPTLKAGGIKAQELLCLGFLLRGTQFKLLFFYLVIAPRLDYLKIWASETLLWEGIPRNSEECPHFCPAQMSSAVSYSKTKG